jgi:uncharacterized protein (TIGR02147 family)
MKQVFEYDNYREFLRDFYNAQKAERPYFSYRLVAAKVGFKSPGHFTQILNGASNISIRLIDGFAKFLKLGKREAAYFQNLVLFCQSKSHEDKRHYYEKMMGFREVSLKAVDAGQYEFYREWYYTAVREILNFYPFAGDYAALARMTTPPITREEARKAVELLEKLGMIVRGDGGAYRLADLVLTSGYDAPALAVSNHLMNSLRLAGKALDSVPREERNISTVSLSVSAEGYTQIVDELRAFRRRMLEIAAQCGRPTRAYQFNFQFFPLSEHHPKDK